MSTIDGVPTITRYTSQTDDEGAVVAADSPEDMEDINKPADDTDEANPYGAIVRVTEDGCGVYNDMSHQIVARPDGSLIIADRRTGGDQSPVVNCVIKDNMITYHNPDPNGPEFLTAPLLAKGTELILSGGTTVFVKPNEDGTYDVTITSVSELVPADGQDPSAGYVTTFAGLGSGKPFVAGANATGAETGGAAFRSRWEATHDDGGKHGTMGKLWVTAMTAPEPKNEYKAGRREVQKGEGRNTDFGQQPGGISARSDKRYDVNWGAGKDWRQLWYDIPGVDASKPTSDPAWQQNVLDALKRRGASDDEIEKMKQQMTNPTAMGVELLSRADDGDPLFGNPNDPSANKPILGDGTVAGGSGDPNAPDKPNDDGDTRSGGSSGLHSLSDFFSSQLALLLAETKPDRRRHETPDKTETTGPKES